jgi:hypothetical protein
VLVNIRLSFSECRDAPTTSQDWARLCEVLGWILFDLRDMFEPKSPVGDSTHVSNAPPEAARAARPFPPEAGLARGVCRAASALRVRVLLS